MKFRAFGDRIIVKQVEAENKTASGIVLPDTAKEKPSEGEVISVGPGRMLDNGKREEIEIEVGDKVIFSKFGGLEVKIDGEDYVVLRQSDILIILEK